LCAPIKYHASLVKHKLTATQATHRANPSSYLLLLLVCLLLQWSVGTILTGLLSFMYDTQPTTGSISTSKQEKQRLAQESLGYNCRNATFRKLFPQWQEEHSRRQAAAAAAAQQAAQQQQLSGQQQQPPPPGGQQQQWPGAVAPGGQAGAGVAAGRDNKGGFLTVALVVIVLAIAAVPFFGNDGPGLSISALSNRFSS
jgi:ubiquitin-conjugating enzyme E2 J2